VQPVVFCGLFPVDAADFEKLRDSIQKAAPQRRVFSFEMETSAALGFGFRCGFLGLLHLEIIQERLSREYDLDLITTAPSWSTSITCRRVMAADQLHNPADMPDPPIDFIEEPWIEATIYPGRISRLDPQALPGPARHPEELTYVGGRAQITYELPLNEVVFDFYDRLKSISRGYASFDYHQIGHREGDLVKMRSSSTTNRSMRSP
jgi:GTP-binding protein LepA